MPFNRRLFPFLAFIFLFTACFPAVSIASHNHHSLTAQSTYVYDSSPNESIPTITDLHSYRETTIRENFSPAAINTRTTHPLRAVHYWAEQVFNGEIASGFTVATESGPITDPGRLLTGQTMGQANAIRGNTFQRSVHDALRLPENTRKVAGRIKSGHIINTEPDLLGLKSGVTDVKDVVNISYTKQLQAQVDYAIQSGQTFNIVISPRTATVSRPLQRIVRSRGGVIVQYNPVSNSFSEVIFQGNRVIR